MKNVLDRVKMKNILDRVKMKNALDRVNGKVDKVAIYTLVGLTKWQVGGFGTGIVVNSRKSKVESK